tara:strand:+ start:642 stop:2945 length:2304 start_codon:yes stop_codon:yes gene_type:complete
MKDIIAINRSFIESIDVTERKINKKEEGTVVKIFTVPYELEAIKDNITVRINTPSKTSKEQAINQAIQFHLEGNISEAIKCYQCCINRGFNDHRVFSNYGAILLDLGELQKAEVTTRKAIELNPNSAEAHSNLGNLLTDLGKLKEAELSLNKAIEINPNLAIVHYNLGNILNDLGKLVEAKLSYCKAIELKSDFADAHLNLGNVLRVLGELKEAELYTRKAIELKPDFIDAYLNLGSILKDLGKLQDAKLFTIKAIEMNPELAIPYYNLGNILNDFGKLREAELSYRKAIELNPNYAKAHLNLGSILEDLGNFVDAINQYKQAIKSNDKLSLAKEALIFIKGKICDWSNQDIQSIWLSSLGIEGSSISPFALLYYEDNPLKSLKRSQNLYREKYQRPEKKITFLKNKKIHIGYFSADFKDHPVMHLIAPILELHDKAKFNIYLYYFGEKDDDFTQRARKSGCIFKDIKKLSHIETVDLARNDKIDIAIDLMGYTKHNRFSIFSYRVAPIQINYLGYPGSLGTNKIDYIIADKIVIPNGHEKFYSEKIIRMPNCYLCTDDKMKINKKPISRKDFNLPAKGFIFTCFNDLKKITPNEFDIWMKLLSKTKDSIIWLKGSNSLAINNLRAEAAKRNVDKNRLIFAKDISRSIHLARHSLGDLGLDTFAFNGCSTSVFGLWAGMPILTKIGESFSARFTASLLNSMGLAELIAYNNDEYEQIALRLANEPDELFELKNKIRHSINTSPLFNSELFTRDLESKYIELVNTHPF